MAMVWVGNERILDKNEAVVQKMKKKRSTQIDKKSTKDDTIFNASTWEKLKANKNYLGVLTTFQHMGDKAMFL